MRRIDEKHQEYLDNKRKELAEKYGINIEMIKDEEAKIHQKIYDREIKKYNGLDPGGLVDLSLNILERYLRISFQN